MEVSAVKLFGGICLLSLLGTNPLITTVSTVALLAFSSMQSASALTLVDPLVTYKNRSPSSDYPKSDFLEDWNVYPPSSQTAHFSIVPNPHYPSQSVLQITCLANQVGGGSGIAFNAPLVDPSIPEGPTYDHLIFEYDMHWGNGSNVVDFGHGGKAPGLASRSDPDNTPPSGCISNVTGASVRPMWEMFEDPEDKAVEKPGAFGYYYSSGKEETCGTYEPLNNKLPPVSFKENVWQHIKIEVKESDPSVPNGFFALYVDGALAATKSDVVLRTDPSLHITYVMIDSFYGGSDADKWAPKTNQVILFDNFTISLPAETPENKEHWDKVKEASKIHQGFLRGSVNS